MSKTQDATKQDERAKRLADALRANLRKRKERERPSDPESNG
ncbi:MAG: hypothetical protein ABL918_01370 [Chakrabartia sp.]